MQKQVIKAKSDYSKITGNLEEKIVVQPFNNLTNYKGKWKIDTLMPHYIADKIKYATRTSCSTTKDRDDNPINVGKKEKALFVITGDIKKFDVIKTAEINAAVDRYREYTTALVCIEINIG